MRAGQIVGPGRLEWVEVPLPEVGEGQMLVRLEAAAICGSDLPFFKLETDHPSVPDEAPLPAGLSLHELVGHVAQSRSGRFREGDRVLALPKTPHLGLSECFLSEPALAVPIPDGPAERLVLSQPLGTVVHGCLKLPNILGYTAVVVGQGPIGLMFTALLRRMGVVRLLAADLLPERLDLSLKMGATHTVCGGEDAVKEAVRDLTGGRGADLVVEVVGLGETLNLCAALGKRASILLAFGVPHRARYDFAFRDFFFNEGRLINSLGPDIQHDFALAVEMVAGGYIDVGPLITHRLPLSRAQEGFELFAARADGAIKVILEGDGR